MVDTPYPLQSAVFVDWERATATQGFPVPRPTGAGDVGIIVVARDEDGDYRVCLPLKGAGVARRWVHEDALTPVLGAPQDAPRVRVVVASDATDCNGWAVASVIKGQTVPPPPDDGPWHGIIVDGPTQNGDYFVELDCGALVWVAPSGLTIETEPPRWEPSVGDIVRVTGDTGDFRHKFTPGTVGLVRNATSEDGYVMVAARGREPDIVEVIDRWVALADLAPVDVTDRNEEGRADD